MEPPTRFLNVGGLDNLANLDVMEEDSMLSSLKHRYDEDNIHTYVGDICVVINPYIRLPIYTESIAKFYMGSQFPSDEVAPHLYKVADQSYESMVNSQKDQCFIVSGESGAGKTESVKIVVGHIMRLCRAGRLSLENKITKLNTFLEPFGNAKTGLNNNSSRFGRYLELRFDNAGGIAGAQLTAYLLEKSRVCVRNAGEQNFHSFYQLLAHLHATGQTQEYLLGAPSHHRYLQGQGVPTDAEILNGKVETCGDGLLEEWKQMEDGLSTIGVRGELFNSLMRLLSGILLLGDIGIKSVGSDSSEVDSNSSVERASTMLAVDPDQLAKALTTLDLMVGGEITTKGLTREAAESNRDAVAKMIYGNIFKWIFKMCNEFLSDPSTAQDAPKIGVLDIFGFETFDNNSLEQFCINLANEQLQWFFNNHIFVKEEEEYVREGIDLTRVDFVNNDATLSLLKDNILNTLDEQSMFPRATDATFTMKCREFASHASGAFKPTKADNDLAFQISHYAGDVKYETVGFLEKNRDKLQADVMQCLVASKDKLLAMLFGGSLDDDDVTTGAGGSSATTKKRGNKTVSTIFKNSLSTLVERMSKCVPHFVRCIKPNLEKKSHMWDNDLVMRQLRYAGVLETIKIRKLGYSFRMEFGEFVRQFRSIVYHYHEEVPPNKETCNAIMQAIAAEQAALVATGERKASLVGSVDFAGEAQVGKTKVFMKYYHADMLQVIKRKHTSALLFLQKIVRGHVAREQYKPLRQKARQQQLDVTEMFKLIETHGENAYQLSKNKCDEDDRLNAERPWLERVKQQAQLREAARQEFKKRRQTILIEKSSLPIQETKTKLVNGYFVWERDELYDERVGPLEHPWRSKVDPVTGRTFFRNVLKKTTTWIDPRSIDCEDVRPHDPEYCDVDSGQLPFGWDKAETESGDVFYINHVDGSHCKEHPKEELRAKRAQRDELRAEADVEIGQKLVVINDLKEKRARLTRQAGHAGDTQSRKKFEDRIQDLTTTIDRGTRAIEAIRSKLTALDELIEGLSSRKAKSVLTSA